MKEVIVSYGKDKISFSIEEKHLMGVFAPNEVKTRPAKEVLEEALEKPQGGQAFEAFVEEAKDLLILINDATRPTPTSEVLEHILPHLEKKKVQIMVATGAHRAPTEDEWKWLLGSTYQRFQEHLLVHDAKKSETVHLGTSENGTELHLNRIINEVDRILVIGSVEPHYFAGYTGGRKAFLPGIAAFSTIQQNHSLALRPEARPLALRGNPIHDDMENAIQCLDESRIFSIQTVLDSSHNIYGATGGDIHESFYAAIDMAHEVFCVELDELADVVVSVAPYPMDIDLYQSQKAIENGKLALKEGGILIMVTQCRDGVGGHTFYQLLSSSPDTKVVMDTIQKGYKLGYHKAAKLIETAQKFSMWAISDLSADVLEKVFIESKPDIQTAVDAALALKGEGTRLMVLPEGSYTVPKVTKPKDPG